MDWPVTAGNVFLAVSLGGLVVSPFIGAAGGWAAIPRALCAALAMVFLASLMGLMFAWRAIPGGLTAALTGHVAFLVSALSAIEITRLSRSALSSDMAAGLAGVVTAIGLSIGPFALGPLLRDGSLSLYGWILFANPLVTIASAAGIDLLHVDVIYQLSPLAHRGVALPAWMAACSTYAVLGLAGFGVSSLRPRSA